MYMPPQFAGMLDLRPDSNSARGIQCVSTAETAPAHGHANATPRKRAAEHFTPEA